ncbi:receptor-like protein 12 [Olea europaea var. sylvestris]|uniref:receptor-like protein 12 n=1 Tax=Olea europaea var. sylvestris TaxID=158386 RepID=UPI000C1CF0D4|nr:receptor-like protein 12 [Olea europaea var. sylvestris]
MIVDQKFFQHLQLLVIVLLLSWRATFERSTRMKDVIRCIEKEKEALLKFNDELIDEYSPLSSWGNEKYKKDCCKWTGVSCDYQTNHIVELDLGGMGLRGNISISLLEIQHLKYLDLSDNDFNYSRIPQFIGSLGRLQHLDLSYSNFSGEIPHHLGNLSELNSLHLSSSTNGSLTSTNLDWLSRLHSLKNLSMYSVNLTMATDWLQIITKLTQLQHLFLDSCNLPMVLPPSPFNASNSLSAFGLTGNEFSSSWIFPLVFNLSSGLTLLDLSSNKLQGEIPISLGNMSRLTSLYLYGNQFTGEVPCPALSSSLTDLDLSNNMFNGTIPQCIGSLSKLKSLYLVLNNFEGIITESHFSNLSQLQWLDLSSNPSISFNINLGWNPPFQPTSLYLADCNVGPHFPTWLRTQTRLKYLDISNAEISNTFPDWFWELSPKLRTLNVSNNNFQGVLPDLSSKFSNFNSIDLSFNHFNGSLPILPPNGYVVDLSSNEFWIPSLNVTLSLHLQNNNFTGEIPTSLRSCTFLTFIDLSQNKLTGNIPTWVGDTWTHLVFLSLRSNEFFGSIPSHLCRLANLQVLDRSLNKISGGIPKCLNNLTAMIQVDSEFDSAFILNYRRGFESAFVIWKGKEVEYINTLNLVKLIDLSSNNLVGDVPTEITSLVTLVGLNLSRNNLSGFLPPNIERLKSLDFLDFSKNHFSSGIPIGVSQLDRLGGNPGLCGLPLTKACPKDEIAQVPKIGHNVDGTKNQEEDKLINDGFYISMAVGFFYIRFLLYDAPSDDVSLEGLEQDFED